MSKIKSENESGITLVELLATLSILSVIIILAGSIHLFGQRQFINQTESASQANDFSYAMTLMATELRKQNPGNVEVSEDGILINGETIFYQSGSNLYHEGTKIAATVDSFNPVKDGNKIKISIFKENQMASDTKYHTTIYFRGESN